MKKDKLPITIYQLPFTNKGLTLLEVAISMAILAITLVAVANFFPIGLKSSRRAVNFSEAGMLAQRVLDNIERAAAVYDMGDGGPNVAPFSDGNGIGYFELVVWDTAPYNDNDVVSIVSPSQNPPPSFTSPDLPTPWEYRYPDMDMYAVVTKGSLDIDDNGSIGPWEIEQRERQQVIYVAVYWTEGEVPRADTFVTYIANPFYEKYK